MESKEYKFQCGTNAKQSELTIGQDIRIAELLCDVGLSDVSEIGEMPLIDIVKKLVQNSILPRFLDIVLQSTCESPDWLALTNTELEEVITDFFSLNPRLKSAFHLLRERLITPMTTQTLKNTESTA